MNIKHKTQVKSQVKYCSHSYAFWILITMNLGTPSVYWGVNLCIFSRLETNMPQLFTYLFLILAQILFALHILHSSETSDFFYVLPHYDRPSQSPTEVIEDDGLGNAFMLMSAGRYAHPNHNNKSQSFPGPSLQITVT